MAKILRTIDFSFHLRILSDFIFISYVITSLMIFSLLSVILSRNITNRRTKEGMSNKINARIDKFKFIQIHLFYKSKTLFLCFGLLFSEVSCAFIDEIYRDKKIPPVRRNIVRRKRNASEVHNL